MTKKTGRRGRRSREKRASLRIRAGKERAKAKMKLEKRKKAGKEKAQETAAKTKKKVEKAEPFFRTGIQGFDALLRDGIPTGSSVLVEGGPGSGKTIFCLQTAYNACRRGKHVLYMSFEEPESRLRGHMLNFGWDPEAYEKKGQFVIKRFDALDIARSVEALLSEAKKELLIDVQPILIPPEFKPDLILVDSLTSVASAFSGEENRFRIYMEQLFRYLERQKITSFLIREVSNPTHIGRSFVEKYEAVSFLSDGIIIIYNLAYRNGTRGSAIEVLKMRGSEINKRIVRMDITRRGMKVHPNSPVKSDVAFT